MQLHHGIMKASVILVSLEYAEHGAEIKIMMQQIASAATNA